MQRLVAELSRRLQESDRAGLRRVLREPAGVDFTSNDYLGLSKHPHVRETLARALRDGGFSAPSSRLLRGHTRAHREIEERLARFKGAEAALLLPSGYQANVAVLSALAGRDDAAASDASNHASLIDGLRMAGASKAVYPHLDLVAAERMLGECAAGGQRFLITESYFSMDADAADLAACARIADRHQAALIVDDAHATGIFGGGRGAGLCEEQGIESSTACMISTGGKALGLWGGIVAGPREVIEYLLQRSRPFVFSTAVSPLLAAGLSAALDVLEREPERRRRVWRLAGRLRAALLDRGIQAPGCGPIVPVVIGCNHAAMRVQDLAAANGFDVRAVRPPTVPPGTARVRLSVHADHTEAEVDAVACALAAALASTAETA